MILENKTILLTGASTGIGNVLAYKLAQKNNKLFLIARRIDLLDDLVSNFKNVIPIKCDVGKKEEVEEAYNQISQSADKIDVAILNAGYSVRMRVEDYDSKLAEQIFGANVFGIIYWVEKLIPDMMNRKKGMIVGVSSIADSKGYSKSGFYSASKAAATIYLEGLSSELKKYNVKVLTVRPGFVKTPMTDKNEFDMPLIMSADKAANIIIKGIEKEKRIIQFPWQMVWLTRLLPLIPNRIFEFFEDSHQKYYNK